MAITAIIAAISTASAVIGAGSVAAFTFAGFTGLTAVAASFLVTTAMGAALNALTPKPKLGAAGQQGYSLRGESGAALDHQVVYGEARVGGARVYDSATGDSNQYLHRILAFAGHEVDSYQEIYLNDEVVTVDPVTFLVTAPEQYAGKVRIKQYVGTAAQAADTDLIADTASLALDEGRWTADHKLSGIAYLYVRFEYDANAFPNGVPSVSAKIRGKKVFNPVTSTTAWSDNPALCIRDYLTSDYGLNQPAGRIDDTLVAIAVGVCNQTVESESRYTCNGAFRTGAAPSDILTNLLTSMGGLLWYGQGKWRMKAAAWSAPTVSFDEDDLRSSISLSTRHSRRDNFNSVKGTWAGDDTDWQITDYKEVTDPAFLIADNNVPNVLDFPLPFTSSHKTALRVARIALNRNREQLTFSASFGMRAFQVQVGDFINITNTRFGWTNKAFEVVEWTFGLTDGLDLQINMTLREISEGVFTGVDGSVFEQNNTTLPSAFTGLEINNLTASGGGRTQGDGTFINSTILSWDAASNSFVSYYEVEWKPVADSSYSSTIIPDTTIEVSPVIDGIAYIYRVRSVTALGNKGPFTSIEFTSGGDVTAPNPPTNVVAEAGYKYLAVNFDLPTAVDFNRVEVYESVDSNFGNASSIGFTSGNRFIRTGLGNNVTRYYWVRSQDFSGNFSAFVGPVNATTFLVSETDLTQELIDTIEAAGVEAVNSLPASGDFDGQIVFLLTDNTLYRWDATGSVWSTELFAGIKDLAVTAQKVADNAITVNKIAANAVTTAKIANEAATSAKIATSAITETKIASDAVTTPKIAAGAVTAGEIAAGAVVAGKIAANAVTAGTVAANAVTAGTIAANAVTTTTIAADAITTAKIAAGAVTATEISAGAVTTDKLVAGAVVSNKIAAGAVTADKITVSELSAITGVIGTFSSANTGERVIIEDDRISVFDASNVLRVRIGNLA